MGVIESFGPNTTTELKEGARVIGQPWGAGTFQEYVVVDTDKLVSISLDAIPFQVSPGSPRATALGVCGGRRRQAGDFFRCRFGEFYNLILSAVGQSLRAKHLGGVRCGHSDNLLSPG